LIKKLDPDFIEIDVPVSNIIESIAQKRSLISKSELDNMIGKPRPAKSLVQRDKLETPWDFFRSVFREYKPDNTTILMTCFEHDWSCTKLEKIIKDLTD